jgi:hypothetical protein
MLPVLHLDPTIEPAAAVGAVTVLTDQPFKAELARMPEQVWPDLALSNSATWMPSIRRARIRAKLVLRSDSGSRRKSSPSAARQSKA